MKKQNENGGGFMVKTGDLFKIYKDGLIKLIKGNTDKDSEQIDCSLIKMINCYYGNFSLKQLNWISEKVKYIFRHNNKYHDFKGFKDIQLF
jgi:hypothetical protein